MFYQVPNLRGLQFFKSLHQICHLESTRGHSNIKQFSTTHIRVIKVLIPVSGLSEELDNSVKILEVQSESIKSSMKVLILSDISRKSTSLQFSFIPGYTILAHR